MDKQNFDVMARYELLNRAMSQENACLDKQIKQGLDKLSYIINESLVNYLAKTKNSDLDKVLLSLRNTLQDFQQFCLFPQLTQKRIIAVGGRFSAGKSTFINTLLGKKQLATEIDPTTSIPTYILKGNKNEIMASNLFGCQVLLSQDEFTSLTHEETEKYGSKVGTLLKKVFITDTDFLWDNLALLDTPGYSKPEYGQANQTDAQIAYEQLNSADAIIWLVSAEDGGMKDDDLQFLKRLATDIPKLVLITKSDRKTPKDIDDIVCLTRKLLSQYNIENVKDVLAVSRKTADYPLDDVIDIINNINREVKEISNFENDFYNLFLIVKKIILRQKIKKQSLVKQTNKNMLHNNDNANETGEISENLYEITKKLDYHIDEFFNFYNIVSDRLNVYLDNTLKNRMSDVVDKEGQNLQQVLSLMKSMQIKRLDELSSFKEKMAIAKSVDISEYEANILVKDKDFEIKLALMNNSNISSNAMKILLEEENEELIVASLSSQNLDTNYLKNLLLKKRPKQLQAIARNPFLTEEIQLILANVRSDDVKIWLALNPCITEKTQQILVYDASDDVRLCLADNKNLTENIQFVLSKDENLDIVKTLAINPYIVKNIQYQLLKSDEDVIACLATNTSIVEEIQLELVGGDYLKSSDKNLTIMESMDLKYTLEYIRGLLAKNPSITPDIQFILADDYDYTIRYELAGNKNIVEEVQYLLTEDTCDDVKLNLSKNSSISKFITTILLNQNNNDITHAILSSQNLGISLLDRYLKEADLQNLNAIAKNPFLNEKTQLIFAESENSDIRLSLAKNTNISKRTIDKLYKDSNIEIIYTILSSQKLDMKVFKSYLSRFDWKKREAFSRNPFLTEDIQLILVKDSNDKVREALASNSEITEDIQLILVKDSNDKVREALVSNSKITEDIQSILLEDDNEKIRNAIPFRIALGLYH